MQQPPEGQPQPPPQPYYPPGQQYGPPPGQYPQRPYYPPPQQPKKRRRVWLWIVLGVLAIVVLGCVGVVALASQASKSVNTGSVATTSSSTNAKARSSQHFKVGQVVKVGDTWQVTVNSAKTSQGDDFTTPAAGSQFVIVDITLKNVSSTEQTISSAVNFSLQDATGQKYTETILSGKTPPDGKVAAGSLLRGQLSYEVPTSQKSLTLSFESDIISAGQTLWDIKI